MLVSSRHRAVVQLLAITLHNLLLGIVVWVAVPIFVDGDYRPAHESRLVALHDQVEGTAHNQHEIKRSDNQSPAGYLAMVLLRRAQIQQSARFSFQLKDNSYIPPTSGLLLIRSPPLQLPL